MKNIFICCGLLFLLVLICYGTLWLLSFRKYHVTYGVSFNQNHASSLGLDWKKTYEDMLADLNPQYVRIAAMWNDVEGKEGVFDFSNVDWMMDKAEQYDTKITLVVGQKAPRWPECHIPDWVKSFESPAYEKALLAYVTKVVERYQTHVALEMWQVENEPSIQFTFGECEQFRPDLVDKEILLVRGLDDAHLVMITDSGELSTWIHTRGKGDIFGTTIYRIVRLPNGFIWRYDWIPAAFYRYKARLLHIPLERFFVSELQGEPWFSDTAVIDTPIEVQNETMDIKRLERHIKYVEHIGTSRAYVWGVEWWYWMKDKQGKSEYWDIVKQKIEESRKYAK